MVEVDILKDDEIDEDYMLNKADLINLSKEELIN